LELGQKIKAARLEAGLSQRQLCGETITRNMLSLIENGAARPSMDTLGYLAGRLGKSVSYFLEEQAVTSANQACMALARRHWASGDPAAVLQALEDFREPDEVFEAERGMLLFLALVQLAETAMAEKRLPYARELLEKAGTVRSMYVTGELQRQRLLLLGQLGEQVALPSDDPALLLRAKDALGCEDYARCLEVLGAAEEKTAPRWALLEAEALFGLGQYAAAAEHYGRAEEAFPEKVYPRLEHCYRELGDYRMAYTYACKQRG